MCLLDLNKTISKLKRVEAGSAREQSVRAEIPPRPEAGLGTL